MSDLADAVDEQYMSVAEFARRKRVTRSAVLRAIHEGRVQAERIAGRYMVPRSELLEYGPMPPAPGSGRKKSNQAG